MQKLCKKDGKINMSESFRERLRRRVKEPKVQNKLLEFGMTEKELIDFIEIHIEELCADSDRQCRLVDQNKAVDQVIDEMSDAHFDNFAKEVIRSVYNQIKKKRKKPYDEDTEAEQYTQLNRTFGESTRPYATPSPKKEEQPIPQ